MNDTIYFTFGEFNPPTIGHGVLIEHLSKISKGSFRVYVSQKQDSKTKPLRYEFKLKTIRCMFPKHGRKILQDNDVFTVADAISKLQLEGYKNAVLVCGRDKLEVFKAETETIKSKFDSFRIVPVTRRVPKVPVKEAVKNSDYTQFVQHLPRTMNTKRSKELYSVICKGLQLKNNVTNRYIKNRLNATIENKKIINNTNKDN